MVESSSQASAQETDRRLRSLRREVSQYLRENKERLIGEIGRVVEASVPYFNNLPADVLADVRQYYRDLLQLYLDYYEAEDLPDDFIEEVASDMGKRSAQQGITLENTIFAFDIGETFIWELVTTHLEVEEYSPSTWLELARLRDTFTKQVRHYFRSSYIREERNTIERQLEELRALYNLGRTIVSTVDLEEVLGQILEVATSLMQATMGAILLLDSNKKYIRVVSEMGLSRPWVQREKLRADTTLSGLAIKRNEYVQARDDELVGFELPRAAAGRTIRSVLSIPITVDDEPIGTMELYDTNPRGYTDIDITMLTAFGPQAGVAIKNARLFKDEQRRRLQASTLSEIAQSISESRDLEELLQTVAEKTARALGVDRCSLYFYEPEADALTFMAGYGRSTLQVWLLNQFHVPLSEIGDATARALETRKPVLAENAQEGTNMESRIFHGPGVKSLLKVPLVVKDELIGLMSVEFTSSDAEFTEEDIALADALARQAAIAIQNRRLQERLFDQQLAVKNAEVNERLYQERERSEAVLNATPDAVFVIDKDMKVELTNPAAEFLTGWTNEEARGKNCHEVLYGSKTGKCPHGSCPVDRMLSGEPVAYSEDTLVSREGKEIPAGGTFAPIYGSRGEVESIVAIYRDISQQKELETYALMRKEMDIASGIQSSLLPRERLLAGGVSVRARQVQAKMVGGDWYDYWWHGDKVFLVIGDASGSGVGAALFATMAMSSIRVEAREHESMMQIMEHVNHNLYLANSAENFVTVFFAVLDLPTMTLSYTNAGHEEPLCIGAEDRMPENLTTSSRSLLGIFSHAELDVKRRKLNSGERLVFYTDGLIDAQSPRGKLYGLKRLNRFVSSNRGKPAPEFIDSLMESVLDFCNGEPNDDMTVMVCDIP